MTHGKENTDSAGSSTREISRLRVYFDSPAGQGPGEKRGRGGIEGLRERPPPAIPTGPKAAQKQKQQKQPVMATLKTETPPVVAATVEEEEDLDGAPMEDTPAAPQADKTLNTASAAPEVPEGQAPTEPSASAPANDVDQDGGDDDVVEGLIAEQEASLQPTETENATPATASLSALSATADQPVTTAPESSDTAPAAAEQPNEENTPADATAAEDVPEEAAGDISMASARSSIEPEAAVVSLAGVDGLTPASNDASERPASEQPATDSPAPSFQATRDVSITPSEAPSVAPSQTPTNQELKAEKLYPVYTGPEPSPNRVSILYERCSRRICIDADVIERVRVSRAEGKIEFTIRWKPKEAEEDEDEPEKVAEPELTAKVEEIEDKKPALEGETASETTTTEELITPKQEQSESQLETAAGGEVEATATDATVPKEEPQDAGSPMKQIDEAAPEAAPTAEDAPPSEKDELSKEIPVMAAEAKEGIETKAASPAQEARPDKATSPAKAPTPMSSGKEKKKDTRTWDICRGILVRPSPRLERHSQ